MSREPKKKPGDHARARARHLRRAEISDAIAATRRGETAQVRLHGGLWELRPIPVYDPAEPHTRQCLPALMLVQISGKKLLIGFVCEKDGVFIDVPHGGRFFRPTEIAYALPLDEAARKWTGLPVDDDWLQRQKDSGHEFYYSTELGYLTCVSRDALALNRAIQGTRDLLPGLTYRDGYLLTHLARFQYIARDPDMYAKFYNHDTMSDLGLKLCAILAETLRAADGPPETFGTQAELSAIQRILDWSKTTRVYTQV